MAESGAARPVGPDEIGAVADLARDARREALEYRGGERWLATEAAPEPLEDYIAQLVADASASVVAGFWEGEVVGYGWARRIDCLDGSSIARILELFVHARSPVGGDRGVAFRRPEAVGPPAAGGGDRRLRASGPPRGQKLFRDLQNDGPRADNAHPSPPRPKRMINPERVVGR